MKKSNYSSMDDFEERTRELQVLNELLEQEILERKRVEKDLAEANELSSHIISNVAVGILTYDERGQCLHANNKATSILRATQDQLLCQNYHQIDSWKNSGLLASAQAAVSSGITSHGEFHVFSTFGSELWLDCTFTVFTLKGSNYLLFIFSDFTELKLAQLQIEKQSEDLNVRIQQAESANAAKTEFLANMSHEIRTPLNAVLGFSELLSTRITDVKNKGYADSIYTAGKSLLMLINDILDLSKLEAGVMELHYAPVNPSEIFKEIEQVFRGKTQSKGLRLNFEIDDKLPAALILDESRIRQILLNLVGNAVKFTNRGYISLCMKMSNLNVERATLDLMVFVEDTGVGIPKLEQERIFASFKQQFGQISSKHGGAGLGLQICKRLVEMMNGTMKLDSEVGEGSRFSFLLKDVEIASSEALTIEKDDIDIARVQFVSSTILVVDDIDANRKLLKELLGQTGLYVLSARNGNEAILIADEELPDLILMDIRMPVMDGIDATKKLKTNLKTCHIPIIALTASVEEHTIHNAKVGFDGFLQKPVSFTRLIEELAKYIMLRNDNYADLVKKTQSRLVRPGELLPEQIAAIKNKLGPLFRDLGGAIDIAAVSSAAEIMIKLGHEYSFEYLIYEGNELLGGCQTFNVDKIQPKLHEITDFLTERGN